VRGDDDFMMVVAWLVAALWGRRPYPVLVLNGEQGTGKSVFSRMIRSLVDPNAAPIRALSKHEHDLAVSAGNSWVLAFDNISSVPSLLSDALAGLATGRGFATRKHYTGREEEIFQASRPILLNGIPLLTERADLADRTLTIHLAVIPDDARRPEDELFAAFDARQPAILGALLDGMSAALRYFPTVKIEVSPRMADLVKVVTAAEPGLAAR
jgi:putative DNA primase/helicase